MAEPFTGQLSLVGFNFAPQPPNWALAAGQTLQINTNSALFALFGTMYGGNGVTNFMLPNLQGAVAIGAGQIPGQDLYVQGQTGGQTTVPLKVAETPGHTHTPMGRPVQRPIVSTPIGNSFADSSGNLYSTSTSPLATMSPLAVSMFGGGGAHNNMMPFLGLYWIIALQGIFPTRG
jgi:microcystin-dependent protein